MRKSCSVDNCGKPAHARGLCNPHYLRSKRHNGNPLGVPSRPSLEDRLWAKVEKTETCWIWRGAVDQKGYGMIWDEGARPRAHRVSWELVNGPIPEGLQVDHKCHNHACVNPSHLRPLTPKQNNEHRLGSPVNNTSGVRGVYWHKKAQKWMVSVGHNGRNIYAGLFPTVAEAEAAAIAKRNELHTHNDRDRTVA